MSKTHPCALVLIDVNKHTKCELLTFTHSKDMMGSQKTRRRDPDRAHLRVLCHPKADIWLQNLTSQL